jgi:hypothetical protein
VIETATDAENAPETFRPEAFQAKQQAGVPVVVVDGKQYPYPENFTHREWGWLKRHANVRPATLLAALKEGDMEVAAVIAYIVMRRAGETVTLDELLDLPGGEITADTVAPEADSLPPTGTPAPAPADSSSAA